MQPASGSAVYQKNTQRYSGIAIKQNNDLQRSSITSTFNSDFSDLDIQQATAAEFIEQGIAQILPNKSSDLGGGYKNASNVASVQQIPQMQDMTKLLSDVQKIVQNEVQVCVAQITSQMEQQYNQKLQTLQRSIDTFNEGLRRCEVANQQLTQKFEIMEQRFANVFGNQNTHDDIRKHLLEGNSHNQDQADSKVQQTGTWSDKRQLMGLAEELYSLKGQFLKHQEEQQQSIQQNSLQSVEISKMRTEIQAELKQVQQLVSKVLHEVMPEVLVEPEDHKDVVTMQKVQQPRQIAVQQVSFACYLRSGNKILEAQASFEATPISLMLAYGTVRQTISSVHNITQKYRKFIATNKIKQTVALHLKAQGFQLEILVPPEIETFLAGKIEIQS